MNRVQANYWVDLAIGIGGLASAISGVVSLLSGDPTTGFLGIGYQAWSNLHTWSSLAAILGVFAHMALHWKWMIAMTRPTFSPVQRPAASERLSQAAVAGGAGTGLSRRAFLALGGAVAVVAGAAVAGYKAVLANAAETGSAGSQTATTVQEGIAAETSSSGSQTATTAQEGGVACPHNLVNDPYPGRCRHYVDSDGDGLCDFSVPGSGSSVALNGEGAGFSQGSRRAPGF